MSGKGFVWLALILAAWVVVYLCYQIIKTAFLLREFVS